MFSLTQLRDSLLSEIVILSRGPVFLISKDKGILATRAISTGGPALSQEHFKLTTLCKAALSIGLLQGKPEKGLTKRKGVQRLKVGYRQNKVKTQKARNILKV